MRRRPVPCRRWNFNPRSPHGERLAADLKSCACKGISTHAPRTGSDASAVASEDVRRQYFNPRSPHGERLVQAYRDAPEYIQFQPTLPARGATGIAFGKVAETAFQPTLPARGATSWIRCCPTGCLRFQPTLPARGATLTRSARSRDDCNFNPRSPHGERRSSRLQFHGLGSHFNPRSPHGERLVPRYSRRIRFTISTHAPRTGSDYTVCRR